MRALRAAAALTIVALVTAGITLAGLVWLPGVLAPDAANATTAAIVWPDAVLERTFSEPPAAVERFTILAVGDLMAHTPQLSSAKTGDGYDFEPCFAPVAPRITAADLAIGNLETTLSGPDRGYTGYPMFNTPDAFAEALVQAGFDVLTTANNHTLDRGPTGVARTLDVLDTLGAQHTGQGQQRLGARRRAAGDAGGEVERDLQRLVERGRVGRQPRRRAFLALHRQRGGDVAALQHAAGRFLQRALQPVEAVGQAQADIEPPAVDAADFPEEGGSIRQRAALAGEAGHG